MEPNKTFRAVSNLDDQGRDPSLNRRCFYGGGVGSGRAEIDYFDSIGKATSFLLRAGGGGVVYLNADDSVAAVVKPEAREYRGVTQGPESKEEYFASARAAREWLRKQRSTGWIDQYDPMIAKFTPREKLEAK